MRRIVILLFILLILSSTCLAQDSSQGQEERDLKQLISALREIDYRFDVGITYPKYNELFSNAYVMNRRFRDNYPNNNLLGKLNDAITVYEDLNSVWYDKVQYNIIALPNSTTKNLKQKYPDLQQYIRNNMFGGWHPDSAIRGLSYIGRHRINVLEQIINSPNLDSNSSAVQGELKSTFGFTFSNIDDNGFLPISALDPDGPAALKGVQIGDKIGQIDNVVVSSFSHDQCIRLLTSEQAKKIALKIKRNNQPDPLIIVLEK